MEMKIPPYIFDTDDLALHALDKFWDISDPAVSIAWITRGGWKTDSPIPDGYWWQDNNLMDDDDFWSMVNRLQNGDWK